MFKVLLLLLSASCLQLSACQPRAPEREPDTIGDSAAEEPVVLAATDSDSLAWAGSGFGRTEVFEIRSPTWHVQWRARETRSGVGVFHVVLFTEDREYTTTVANIFGSGEGTKRVEGAGLYYLTISGNRVEWRVKVEAGEASTPPDSL